MKNPISIQSLLIGLCFIVGFLTSNSIIAQEHWSEVLQARQQYQRSLQMLNADTGMIWGEQRNLFRTVDGGDTWQPIPLAINFYNISPVYWTSYDTALAFNGNGNVLRTTDAGASWNQIHPGLFNPNNTLEIAQMYFTDSQTGWVCGGSTVEDFGFVMHTEDGGQNWAFQHESTTHRLQEMYFLSETIGYACGIAFEENLGVVLKTTNGGKSWIILEEEHPVPLVSIFAISEQRLWACGGDGQLTVSNDGGTNWIVLDSLLTNQMNTIAFSDELHGYAAGRAGLIHTTNGGQSWQEVPLYEDLRINEISLAPDSRVWIVGNSGVISNTSDQGLTWNVKPTTSLTDLTDVAFWDDEQGYALGNTGKILHTSDGGQSWQAQNPGSFNDLHSIAVLSSSVAWAVGEKGTLIYTVDSGNVWQSGPDWTSNSLNDVFFAGGNHGWVVGENGLVKSTQDGGVTWTDQISGTSSTLRSVYFADPLNGWIAGDESVVLHTDDGGLNWIAQDSPEFEGIYTFARVFFTDEQHGWMTGIESMLYGGNMEDLTAVFKTTDGGISWERKATVFTPYKQESGIFFSTADSGWVCTDYFMLFTADGGDNWIVQSDSFGTIEFSDMWFTKSSGWAVGKGPISGGLYRTAGYGGTGKPLSDPPPPDQEPIPKEFVVSNPFTDWLSIIVTPQNTYQNLRFQLFNLNGQVVQDVSGLQPGCNTFDSRFLPAGIYGYRIFEGEVLLQTGKVMKRKY